MSSIYHTLFKVQFILWQRLIFLNFSLLKYCRFGANLHNQINVKFKVTAKITVSFRSSYFGELLNDLKYGHSIITAVLTVFESRMDVALSIRKSFRACYIFFCTQYKIVQNEAHKTLHTSYFTKLRGRYHGVQEAISFHLHFQFFRHGSPSVREN